jgi:hypothetical protein
MQFQLAVQFINWIAINQICLDILRAALTREGLVLLSDILDGLPGEGPGLGSSPSCPLVASFNA